MDQQRWYRETIPLKNQVIVDLGANVGALSQFFWEASEGTSRLISVEPLLQNVAVIRDRIQRAAASAWTVEACAASGVEGTMMIGAFQRPEGGWNGVIGSTQGLPVSVPARRLSLLVPQATVVKVDIEGHEYEVLDEALPHLGPADELSTRKEALFAISQGGQGAVSLDGGQGLPQRESLRRHPARRSA